MEPKLRIISSPGGDLPVWQVPLWKAGAFQNGADRPFRIQFQLPFSQNKSYLRRAAISRRVVPPGSKSLPKRAHVFISLSIRRHLYTNKSLTFVQHQFVDRDPEKKFTTNLGERKLRALGMALAHRHDGQGRDFYQSDLTPEDELDGGLRV
jgi:hypothetical protein